MRKFLVFGYAFWMTIGVNQVYSQVLKSMLRLPDTGQNQSYTQSFGEDNDYNFNTPFFIDYGDGTVLDTVTGLTWQKTDGGEMTVGAAITYCDTLTLGGQNDWRLPNAAESFSIMNQNYANPSLDAAVFTTTNADYWWTSDRQANDTNKVWVTNAGGGIGNHPKNETISDGGNKRFHVRAVRSDPGGTFIPQRFENLASGSVWDKLNGLEWNPVAVQDSMSWEEALAFAENSNALGFGDWRLPNIKELRSLNDESILNPSVNPVFFPNVGVGKFWSSTTLPNQTTKSWIFDTHFGITTYAEKTSQKRMLMVRNYDNLSNGIDVLDLQFSIYPNPFADKIRLNHETDWKLYDSQGKMLGFGRGEIISNLSNLNQGIYLLVLEGRGRYKLVKQ